MDKVKIYKKLEIELDIEDDVLRAVDPDDLFAYLSDDELEDELESRNYDFSRKCDKAHLGESPSSVTLPGNEEVMERFAECHTLLNWQQWNHIFSTIEKENDQQRSHRLKKYDRL